MTDKMINGVVTRKLEILDTNLAELRPLGTITLSQLKSDWRTLKAIQHNLQILIEVVIDICNRLLAVDRQTPSTTSREAVKRCIFIGILSDYKPYEKMVQFRNFIVHNVTYGVSVLENNSNVTAAWVFGSGQNGHIRVGGALDIGVLYEHMPDLDKLVELRSTLQNAYHFDTIDLVTLNHTSPILCFEAISGRNIFKRNIIRFAEFFTLTARKYEDAIALFQRGIAASI